MIKLQMTTGNWTEENRQALLKQIEKLNADQLRTVLRYTLNADEENYAISWLMSSIRALTSEQVD